MDKIYSRKRLLIPKIKLNRRKSGIKGTTFIKNQRTAYTNGNYNSDEKNLKKYISWKWIKTIIIVSIAIFIANRIIATVEPTMDVLCIDMAKSIATKISNEQATVVMRKL